MANISWKTGVNGDWTVATDWSTNTVPGAGDAVTISAAGGYIVTITSADLANSLTFNAALAALSETAGSLTVTGQLTVDAGFVSLNRANTIGSVALAGGTLAFGTPNALGAGNITISGGELLATANETLSNNLTLSGTSTIAAAHGTTLVIASPSLTINAFSTMNFGAPGQDGIVALQPAAVSVAVPNNINVVAGTLKAAAALGLSFITGAAQVTTTVDAGATLDAGGFNLAINNLLGNGAIIDSGAAAALTLSSANFSGTISGALSVTINGTVILDGASTYSGITTISGGNSLQLGTGGAIGSIGGGAISDGGTLIINRNNALTLTNAISGGGSLQQIGTGVTSINNANTYTGGTTLSAGTLAIGNAGALGTGAITINGGELLGTANETLTNVVTFSGTSTIAAAHGTTLVVVSGLFSITGNSTLNFGAPGQDGVVVIRGGGFSVSPPYTINVVAGTLKAADSNLDFITHLSATSTTVNAGATLDAGGFNLRLVGLLGGGAVVDSGAAATLTLDAATFSGAISGALSVTFNGNAALSGLENYSGGATLNGAIVVANAGTYDIVSNNGIAGSPASMFINNGLFEKTGSGGVSSITSNFVNNGTLDVFTGSVQFSGGFTNNGVIHGIVSQSGGVTTIRAMSPNDVNGDGRADILWRGADGALIDWGMNGSVIATSGFVTANGTVVAPDASFRVAGLSDFSGDGNADVLWRSSSGAMIEWTMNGSVITSSANITMNGALVQPDASFSVAGVGDFNGDNKSDILWRSTSGALIDWAMNGSAIAASANVTANGVAVQPDPSFSIAGVGDFDGDGKSDILWRNSSGSLVGWLMNGNTVASSAAITMGGIAAAPDASWHVVEVGDFNGDGNSDILWRNDNGALAQWLMNGTTISQSVTPAMNGTPISPDGSFTTQSRPTNFG